ncbi:PREDICTED: uncharacterized protein LOC105367965 [Ceratosolen solmsi marchali]|uniref:Uncharacterized protein LOC105367965 n=1 Tax=Ceratosolen solmsi marchali TaxID=326594 RepID=A0AAJ6YVL0_9HYME|nr:PREDICTED: uncharacterized protein LOC105367965 [Ceratosolen solmsi marchali]
MRSLMVLGLLGLLAKIARADDFLTNSFNDCIGADSWSSCLKHEVLAYLDEKLGITTEARSLDSVDEALVSRAFKYLKTFEYGVDLPFIDGRLKYRPGRSIADLDVEFKNSEVATSQARGILKKKLLLPFLLLLKLKLKALMPIFVAIIGFKAMKALILSKLAILLVIGFIAVQFFKKGGMAAPMGVTMEPAPTYGLPPITTTTSGYEPVNTWDGNGPYSRIWTPSNGLESAQNLAYNYYSGSSSNSYGAPSSSSSGSSSAATGSSSVSTNY